MLISTRFVTWIMRTVLHIALVWQELCKSWTTNRKVPTGRFQKKAKWGQCPWFRKIIENFGLSLFSNIVFNDKKVKKISKALLGITSLTSRKASTLSTITIPNTRSAKNSIVSLAWNKIAFLIFTEWFDRNKTFFESENKSFFGAFCMLWLES